MKPLAVRAAYADLKLVKTRQVAQLIFEIPISEFDAAYEVLGGLPTPDSERWFAIAAIKEVRPNLQSDTKSFPDSRPQPETSRSAGAKKDWRDVPPAQQAGMRCDEAAFVHFLREARPDDWHETQDTADCVRLICGVESRTDLGTNHRARMIWKALDDQYQAWKAAEHA